MSSMLTPAFEKCIIANSVDDTKHNGTFMRRVDENQAHMHVIYIWNERLAGNDDDEKQ